DVADSFHYVYQPLSGDGEIVARIVDIAQTDFWAKGGVMIRESLDAGARNAFMLETPPGHDEPVFQWRTDSGGFTSDSDNHIAVVAPAPVWLRVVRSGNSFTGYYALDKGGSGKKHGGWIQMGPTDELDMAPNVYVGLALTPHNNGSLNTPPFTRVKAVANGLPDSAYSNVDSVRFALPGQTLTIAHGFENSTDLTANGSAEIFPNPAPVGTFSGHQDIGGVATAGAATFQTGAYSV